MSNTQRIYRALTLLAVGVLQLYGRGQDFDAIRQVGGIIVIMCSSCLSDRQRLCYNCHHQGPDVDTLREELKINTFL